ncbi:hypothetical protein OPQ81_011054 [Rhizoctonia solani]|nr:hypothetical protein OPQ81_011054 [Rhizoctonia solani]
MNNCKLTALELVLTFLTMFGPVTKESVAAVCVLFEAVLSYDYERGKFDKDAVKKVCGVADHLIAMAEFYGIKCDAKQLGTPGGRRAILRVILGPVIEELAPEGLERMRNDAVEAMMVLTFKPLDEVQDMLTMWAKQAIGDGRYQTRVHIWTGLPMGLLKEAGETEGFTDVKTPPANDEPIAMMSNCCDPALEIVFTFLTMFGPVTKESVAATGVLLGAVLGYTEATGKFDREIVKKVPTVSEQLCSLALLYGIRCEPRMLNTPPGTRAILRELVGPIIEEHSPTELEEVQKDAAAAIMLITCKPLEQVKIMVNAWAVAARKDGRYQARVSAWTGQPPYNFDHEDSIEIDELRHKTRDEMDFGHDSGDNANANEGQGSMESNTYLEIATSATVVKLITVQAHFSMNILPKREAPFTTMFSTPMDVCLGRSFPWTSSVFDGPCADILEVTTTHPEDTHNLDEGDANVLMDALDEEDYHRLVGFRFPAFPPPTPVLGTSTGSSPDITPLGSPTFEQWITTWHTKEMDGWNVVLQEAAEKEARAEERKMMFGPHADAWEIKQLSQWSAALKGNGYLDGMYAGIADVNEAMETLEAAELTRGKNETSLLKKIGKFFGLE